MPASGRLRLLSGHVASAAPAARGPGPLPMGRITDEYRRDGVAVLPPGLLLPPAAVVELKTAFLALAPAARAQWERGRAGAAGLEWAAGGYFDLPNLLEAAPQAVVALLERAAPLLQLAVRARACAWRECV